MNNLKKYKKEILLAVNSILLSLVLVFLAFTIYKGYEEITFFTEVEEENGDIENTEKPISFPESLPISL